MPYQIVDWDKHFENDRSRTRKQCSFVCVPNKQSGMGLSYILREPDGPMIYGLWHLLLGACSQQPCRNGWLTMNGECAGSAWGVVDLSVKFHRPEKEFERALEVLTSEKVAWIRWVESPSTHRGVTVESPRGTLNERREEKERSEGMGAVELPHGFPKTEQEAVAGGIIVGADEETCRTTWNIAMSRGGLDAKGRPIFSWAHHVKAAFNMNGNRRVENGLPDTKRAVKERTNKEALLLPLQCNGPARWTLERPPARDHFKREGDYEVCLDAYEQWKKQRMTDFFNK